MTNAIICSMWHRWFFWKKVHNVKYEKIDSSEYILTIEANDYHFKCIKFK